MKKNTKILIGAGMICILLLLISSRYAVVYNHSRLVIPTDFGNYKFQARDLPMVLSIALMSIYIFSLLVLCIRKLIKNNRQAAMTNTTPKLNPKLGVLGFLGFLGFAGIWSYSNNGNLSAFVFFVFFGFFGFYYEGKMSKTFMDERFQKNVIRAKLKAYDITFTILFFALLIFSQGWLFSNDEYKLMGMIITFSLTFGLKFFLEGYFLYHYDHDAPTNEREG